MVGELADQLDVVTVCPAEVYGPEDDAFVTAGNIRDIVKSWPALACHGGTSVVHVDDVANGMTRRRKPASLSTRLHSSVIDTLSPPRM